MQRKWICFVAVKAAFCVQADCTNAMRRDESLNRCSMREVEEAEEAMSQVGFTELLQLSPLAASPQKPLGEFHSTSSRNVTHPAVPLGPEQFSVPAAPHVRATEAGMVASVVPPPTAVRVRAYTLTWLLAQHTDIVEAVIPMAALGVGCILVGIGLKTVGILSIYFGMQSGLSLYMKTMLSQAVVSQELGIKGVPAAFLVTSIQQGVAFLVLCLALLVLQFIPHEWVGLTEPYRLKRLETKKEWGAMLVFSLAFAVNIGLNNFSLSLLAVSLNLIVRSCLPIMTLTVQALLGTAGPVRSTEVVLMMAGVFFASLSVLAETEDSQSNAESNSNLILGLTMCSVSNLAAALNLVLAAAFGTYMKMSPLDTTFYMALPVALLLLPAAAYAAHPVSWPGAGLMTDFEVMRRVLQLSPSTMVWLCFSGVFAAGYNVLNYTVVQKLSATQAAFAGNFNKAASIALSISLGLEHLPSGAWGALMVLAIAGNVGSFTRYSLLKSAERRSSAPMGNGKPAENKGGGSGCRL